MKRETRKSHRHQGRPRGGKWGYINASMPIPPSRTNRRHGIKVKQRGRR